MKNSLFGSIFLFTVFIAAMEAQSVSFRQVVELRFKKDFRMDFARVCPIDSDLTSRTIFAEYGAVFIANKSVALPPKCIFDSEEEVRAFQILTDSRTEFINGFQITLQSNAMAALLKARAEAMQRGLNITPLDGSIAAGRSFDDTVRLWNSRLNPGLNYWIRRRRLTYIEAEAVRRASIRRQIARVLEWERSGIFFSRDRSKSILYSAAPPGASQHIHMLAFDVEQYANSRVRDILAQNGWFQTVRNDRPHFTYLGLSENELPQLGLKAVNNAGQKFWIPN